MTFALHLHCPAFNLPISNEWLYNEGMKKIFATAAMAISLTTHATEEAMQQALNTWQQQVADYEAAMQAAPSDEARAAITPPDGRDIAPVLWQSINARTGTRENPRGKGRIPTFEFEKSWALPAIIWILEHQQAFTAAFTEEEQAQLTYFGEALIDSLVRIHFSNPGIAAACPVLSATSSVREYELLQKIYQRNQDKSARACAALGMSLMLNNPMVNSIEGSEAMARAKRLYYLKQSILLAQNNTRFGSRPITEIALEQAYYLRHLSTGCIAPQLQVKDQQGASHTFPIPKKTNLLIFWSPTNLNSAAMVRDIDKLKARYSDIEICPIMPYAAAEEQQKALQELGIPMSYTDDAKGTAGTTYRVAQLPTAILISRNSTILYGGLPDIKLQNALETEAAAISKSRPTIIIKEKKDTDSALQIQPGSTPTEKKDDSIPGLREMPEF